MTESAIKIRGARQHNLKGIDLDIPLGALTVVTGPSGSGKSSLAFDTIYAEGQRRYVETFSPYARQFLDRQDRPHVDRIEGIPPAIAIDQVNPVRTSRSTVGTMSELADHLKLLFARAALLYCRGCAAPVKRDAPQTIATEWLERARLIDMRAVVTFTISVPANFTAKEITGFLEQQGYTRILAQRGKTVEVIEDRVRLNQDNRGRLTEALEAAFARGHGRLRVYPMNATRDRGTPQDYSSRLHCAHCDIDYSPAMPALFSFNSPVGACETCRGFGRTQGIDYGLVIPDTSRSLADGAIKPFRTQSGAKCQRDLLRHAKASRIPTTKAWAALSDKHKRWVLEGEGSWRSKKWYGVAGYFAWLERKSYRMHVRVLLSRYRSYDQCPDCHGARLQPDAFLFRLASKSEADAALAPQQRFRPSGVHYDEATLEALPGLTLHDINTLPITRARDFFANLKLPAPLDEATEHLLGAIRARFDYLVTVGLGYLTLDRQSRTLSGGEVQRINLTTALGTSLTNTLFVLDEPSIGLHPRDIGRLIDVLHNLRDAGNTLLVVEHDREIMLASDRLLDMGPAAGEHGGEVRFFGPTAAIARADQSLTGDWLMGRKTIDTSQPNPPDDDSAWLHLKGVRAHNLKNIDVALPHQRLVCIAGVSGSGKSTLIEDVLYRALRRQQGQPTEAPGEYDTLSGAQDFDAVVLVDQSAIGRTTRSSPASYVGAFNAIRKRFVDSPLARERGYTLGTFSFNTGKGRCPTCGGNGFEHIEMQFLSDVYLRCPDCDGRRYRDEILEIDIERGGRTFNIADVLELTVDDAAAVFAQDKPVQRALAPLVAVGLGYLKLGQPVPTLSGGEAQRLKLAGRLAAADDGKRVLFLFDEPTTGSHFNDIAVLLAAFRELIARGHSVIVIEHNLDVIRAADWIIELGPEGGEAGGEIVMAGTPEAIADLSISPTGQALADYQQALQQPATGLPTKVSKPTQQAPRAHRNATHAIEVINAREHNLKNISVNIPRDTFNVITGLSGSGKSTLAFNLLFAEGQRRYLESLNAYARSIVAPASRPEVDAINGIPPTVAIEQRTSRGGWKSTVGTMTEIHHFLRLLFVRLGTQHCPDCGTAIELQSEEAVRGAISQRFRGRTITLYAPLVVARKGYYTDLAKWAHQKGYAHLRVDGALQPTGKWPRLKRFTEHDIELPVGTINVTPKNNKALAALLDTALGHGKGLVIAASDADDTLYSTRRACPSCGRSFAELDPRLFSYNARHGWCPACTGTGQVDDDDDATPSEICPDCHGARLNPTALAVTFATRSIAALAALPVRDAMQFFNTVTLDKRARTIGHDALVEIRGRLAFLDDVGIGYLTLDRAAPTLSGGEAQRIRIAAQLGSNLAGVCYVLDEPTIGLHPRDHARLLTALKTLRTKGNTVVVVEHDENTIRAAEHVIDLGPGAGADGGEIIAEGSVKKLQRVTRSMTGQALKHPPHHPQFERRTVVKTDPAITVNDAHLHNLRIPQARIPLARLVCVTGVSGSGKSSLVRGVLGANLPALINPRHGKKPPLTGCHAINGYGEITRVLEVDQTPIGKTPRSCPATYVGIWNDIRTLFAHTTEARLRGFNASRFSFNTGAGRCANCGGQGLKRIEMSFMADSIVACETCNGARFNHETLEIRWREKTIADILAMNIATACDFFSAHPRIHRALALLDDVGLGYLTLGQQSPTLSGGEAQRLKLVKELAKAESPYTGPTLYLLDEPTVGLHIADVEKLTRVLHRLAAAGHSVIVVEHNLDLIAEADWLIDIGPEGGARGGRIVASGAPETLIKRKSATAQALRDFLATRHT